MRVWKEIKWKKSLRIDRAIKNSSLMAEKTSLRRIPPPVSGSPLLLRSVHKFGEETIPEGKTEVRKSRGERGILC